MMDMERDEVEVGNCIKEALRRLRDVESTDRLVRSYVDRAIRVLEDGRFRMAATPLMRAYAVLTRDATPVEDADTRRVRWAMRALLGD